MAGLNKMQMQVWGNNKTNSYLKNLLTYYRFEETAGTTVYDFKGDHNGTNQGATIGDTGTVGKCYSFDGVNQRIRCFAGLGLASNPFPFTIKFNVYLNGLMGIQPFVGSYGTAGNYAGYSIYGNNQKLRILFGNNLSGTSSGVRIYETTNNVLAIGWNYITVKCTDFYTVEVFVNGVLNAAPYLLGGATTYSSGLSQKDLMHWGKIVVYTQGKMDELGVWNRLLTNGEITNAYTKESTGISIL
jgi:hypothetical protein